MSQTHTLGRTATNVRTENGQTIIQYHATDVVAFNADSITLNTGGWNSATTKLRMNQAANQFGLGFQVYQKDFEWFVILFKGGNWDYENPISFDRQMITIPRLGDYAAHTAHHTPTTQR